MPQLWTVNRWLAWEANLNYMFTLDWQIHRHCCLSQGCCWQTGLKCYDVNTGYSQIWWPEI